MQTLSASQLADALEVSRGRVSQWVAAGQLDGCFAGEGRARRFDLSKCAERLGRRLDPGQMMGNGARTVAALKAAAAPASPPPAAPPSAPPPSPDPAQPVAPAPDPPAAPADDDAARYQRARADREEQRAQRERLEMEAAAGRYVLASEVEIEVRRAMAAEVAQFEAVLRSGAQKLAAELGLDGPTVRAVLVAEWRAHRQRQADRAAALAAEAAADHAAGA